MVITEIDSYSYLILGPEVRKLLQTLDPVMPPMMNNILGRVQNQRGGLPMPPGVTMPFPPPPLNVLDKKQPGGPMNLLDRNLGLNLNPLDRKQSPVPNPLDRNPPTVGTGASHLTTFMVGGIPRMSPPGGMRIPPPPTSLLGPAPMDFAGGEKRARR